MAEMQLQAKREATKRFHDAKVVPPPVYTVGTPVWLFDPAKPGGESSKLFNPWSGPWLIAEVDVDRCNAVLLRHDKPQPRRVHFNRLRLYKAPLAPLEKALTGRKKAFVYKVEKMRTINNRKEFLVKWMSLLNDVPDSWVPESAVPAHLVTRFFAQKQL